MKKKKLIAASLIAGAALTLGSLSVASAHDNGGAGRGDKLASILNGLVTKGTLNQAQVDAITKAVTDARTAGDAEREANRAAHIKVITDTLGITADALKARLDAGDSLATIAGAKKDALITAMVAFETKEIDAKLAAGDITADQATKMKANLKDRVTAQVERVPGTEMGPEGMGPKGVGPKGMGPKGMGPKGERGHDRGPRR